ncbi:farnesyltransferase [Mucidula mucida]|nr:farnesyltransferase [Mucidula mucida]
MVLSAMGSVAVSPFPVTVPTLLATALAPDCLQEIPFDAQMARTRNRPLVRRAVTPLHASAFGIVTGVAGPVILWTMVNPTTALLGAGNIFLYAGVYTWMKRKSIWNTWVGSVVGGIPPLMGWTATGGHLIPAQMHLFLPWAPAFDLSLVDNILSPFALFMLLYTWQFPHFNSLSYVVRGSYAQAGYRMLSVLDVRKNATVALRYAFLMIPLCSIVFPLSGLTTWAFALTSLVPNGIFAGATYQWWKHGGEKHARAAFRHSLWQLPVVLGLMMMHKNGMDWTKWLGLKKEEQS